MTTDKIVDKIWSEHDHNKDDNFLYSDGWADACNRFYQELQGKSIIEWHKPSEELPDFYEEAVVYHNYYTDEGKKHSITGVYLACKNGDGEMFFGSPWGDEVYLKDVIAWCYLPKYRGDNNER